MGAGILPVALYKNTLFLLLGQERHNNLWSDFGGGSIPGEKPYETAIREGTEELNGHLGSYKYLETKVKANFIVGIKHDRYTSYLFKTTYTTKLPYYFNNNNIFIENHIDKNIIQSENGLFEKKKINWFSINELKNHNFKNNIRPFYYNIIDTICQEEDIIKETIKNIK